MTTLEFLTLQHREADALFRGARERQGGERLQVIEQLAESLTLHATLEERFFYPALERLGMPDQARTAREEHREARRLLGELLRAARQDPSRCEAALDRLEQRVGHHVGEEERDVFPRLQREGKEQALDASCSDMIRAANDLLGQDRVAHAEREGTRR